MRIALIQFAPVVGDIQGNAARAHAAVRDAAAGGAQVVVFPELALIGYPPRDLLLRAGMAEACHAAMLHIAGAAAACTVIIGAPRAVDDGARPIANSVAVLQGGRIAQWYDKRLLPSYDVFDEHRYFAPGGEPCVVDVAGVPGGRIGIVVCEDAWQAHDVTARATYPCDPLAETAAHSPSVIAVLSASPFVRGKHAQHMRMLAHAARRAGCPVVSVNQSGGFDDLVFDGDARAVWPDGRTRAGARWAEGMLIVDTADPPGAGAPAAGPEPADDLHDLWQALVCGTRAYITRTGHRSVVVGISGGVDSALVAALAVAAVGPANVLGVLMPGQWSSAGSVTDAHDLARRLGFKAITLPITDAHALLAASVGGELARAGMPGVEGLTDENLQSRLRGLQVMAVSNATGAMVLTTGNKSEYAVGYTTLYGDMNGGLAPIGDVLKTDVWALARWLNEHPGAAGFAHAPIPPASIDKAPSAELRPGQTDQDSLPPYDELDAIVRAWVDDECSEAEVVQRTGLPADMVRTWVRAIDRAEFKRFQAAVILKVSARSFGRGRRMPLAQCWRPS